MLVDVQSFIFDTCINTQSMQFLDSIEQHKTTGSSPQVNAENT